MEQVGGPLTEMPVVTQPLVEQVRSFKSSHDGACRKRRTTASSVETILFGEARLLWEIGRGWVVGALAQTAAWARFRRCRAACCVSLEGQGLVVVGAGKSDRRVRQVRLTEVGLRERSELDRRAEAFARSLLEPLSEDARVKLATAMAQVERLLTASMVKIEVTDPASSDARRCIEQDFAELGEKFQRPAFDPAISIPAHEHELTPPNGLFLVARLREEAVGCGGCRLHANAPAEIKRMWVAKRARGLGLGRCLLQEWSTLQGK